MATTPAMTAAGAVVFLGERQYPLPSTDTEPRVFSRATDDYLELSARFVVPVRRARAVKDELTQQVMGRLTAEGIDVASSTQDVTVRFDR